MTRERIKLKIKLFLQVLFLGYGIVNLIIYFVNPLYTILFIAIFYIFLGVLVSLTWENISPHFKSSFIFIGIYLVLNLSAWITNKLFFQNVEYVNGALTYAERIFFNLQMLFNRIFSFPFYRPYQTVKQIGKEIIYIIPVWANLIEILLNIFWIGILGALSSIFFSRVKKNRAQGNRL